MKDTVQEKAPIASEAAAQRQPRAGGGYLAAQLAQSARQTAQRRQLHDARSVAVQRVEGELEEDDKGPAQLKAEPIQRQENRTGMPDNLKAGIESLSGMDMSDVRVHHNSSQPAQLNALAYAQGNDIHLAPGQEQHLPHEAWHVVQQRQGRVQATTQLAGVGVNEEMSLEQEADAMGVQALAVQRRAIQQVPTQPVVDSPVLQRVRQHDYNDRPLRALNLTVLERQNLQAVLDAIPAQQLTHALAQHQNFQHLSQMPAIKQEIQQAIRSVRPGAAVGNILGVQYEFGVGLHNVRIWDDSNPAVEVFHFQLTVIPNGGVANDAVVADQAWQQAIPNMTFNDAVAHTFRTNHVINPIPQGEEEFALVRLAIDRQKASTLVQQTPLAQANFLAEVVQHNQNGTYNTKHHFMTANTYPMLDLDPLANPPAMTAFDGNIEYDVFHNPQTRLWQISHFHGAHNRANVRNIAAGTAGVSGAVAKSATTVTLGGIAGQIQAGPQAITITASALGLVGVRIQIDDGRWIAATANNANPLQWIFNWDAPLGAHVVRAEGQEQRGRRTRIASRNVNVA